MIRITLKIKFRAFGVDLLKLERVFKVPHGVAKVLMNERGVYLAVEPD